MNLIEQLDAVSDEASLMKFIEALAEDLEDEIKKEKTDPSSPYGSGANGWENRDLSSFLRASLAWVEDSRDGIETYQKPENPWKRVADILYCGKIYE